MENTAADSFVAKIEPRYCGTVEVAESMRDVAGKLDHLAATLEDRQKKLMNPLDEAGKTLAEAEQMISDGGDDILGEVGSLASAAKDGVADLIEGGKDDHGATGRRRDGSCRHQTRRPGHAHRPQPRRNHRRGHGLGPKPA